MAVAKQGRAFHPVDIEPHFTCKASYLASAKTPFVMKCKDCQGQCTISYVSVPTLEKEQREMETYDLDYERSSPNYSEWSLLMTVNCSGCVIDSVTCDAWKVISENDKVYDWNGSDDFFEYNDNLDKTSHSFWTHIPV